MEAIMRSPELATSQRSKIVITYKSALGVRRVATLAGLSGTPIYVALAASEVLTRFAFIFYPFSSCIFGLIVIWHSSKSLRISFNLHQTSTTELRSHVKAHASENAETKSEIMSDEAGRVKTLGKRPRKKKLRVRKLMSKVTEEATAENSQLQSNGDS